MKYGIALPYCSARAAATLACQAEQAGWDGCFMGDAIWCEDPMICLAAAAMVTERIRLGTMIVPMPLRKPWKVASEAIALDQLSAGRFILGLGRGATWMGWQAFPDEVTEGRARGEMLDESIDILRGLFARRPFDYPGRHFQVKLSLLDEMYYPPRPLHLPIWVPGAWPRGKSMQRAIKADGLFVEVVNAEGQNGEATPDDVRAICAYVAANRRSQTPFDIVVSGKTGDLEADQQFEKMAAWQAAGATWWVEALFEDDTDRAAERIRQGPPAVSSDG